MSSDLGTELSDVELKGLCKALWSWKFCAECTAGRTCEPAWNSNCPSQRLRRLTYFSKYYARQCRIYLDAAESFGKRTLKNHDDLWRTIEYMRQNSSVTKDRLINALKANPGSSAGQTPTGPEADHGLAVDLAARILTMVNCFSQPRGVSILEQGLHQVPWHHDVSFDEYIERLFPTHWNTDPKNSSRDLPDQLRLKITASRLKKDLDLTLRPTDDLASHLKLDYQSNVLEIFQHTAVLKEHLRVTKDAPSDLSSADFLKLGALPRQLALEVLESIEQTLFPISDVKSRAELRRLIRRCSFDKDAEHFEYVALRSQSEQRVEYRCLSDRLMDLYYELQDPKPRGWLEEWMERRSGGRYVMMATLVGVIIAILLGAAGLAVAIFQTWVNYQAWQHPVSPS